MKSLCVLFFVLIVRGPVPAVADPEPAAGDSPGIAFAEIPAGTFLMGSPATEWQSRTDEQQHTVTITRPYLLSKTEVTQRLWTAVMDTNPSYLDDCPDCPVERVSWFDAIAFCNALSERSGLEPAYSRVDSVVTWNREAEGFRLPTEAEWEYACRAGTTTAYNTGDCLDTGGANFKGYTSSRGCPEGLWRGQAVIVSGFPPNPWGLYDMHGNVSEWCWDYHFPFLDAAVTDPAGPPAGKSRILRGGSFDRPCEMCRAACRQFAVPTRHSRYLGLRLARNGP